MAKIRERNPMNIKMRNGKMTDKYGRPMETDWAKFDKLRGKRNHPAICAAEIKKNNKIMSKKEEQAPTWWDIIIIMFESLLKRFKKTKKGDKIERPPSDDVQAES